MSLKDLGGALICETGSPSRLVERMVKNGLIDKITDPQDSRFVLLQLTDTGLKKVNKIKGIENQFYTSLQKMIGQTNMKQVADILENALMPFPISDTLKRRGFII